MTIASALTALNTQRQNLATNLTTKGVASVGTETLAQLVPKVLDITSGGGEGWQPPSDWIDIDNVVDGNINLLVADITLATYAFICTTSTGQYNVDWGDGTSNNYNSDAVAQHTYAIGTGQLCSRGYTTFKIVISPVSGNITRFYITSHTSAKQNQNHGYLQCVYGATYTTSLTYAFNTSSVSCRFLEGFKSAGVFSTLTDISYMFNSCSVLQGVNISGMTSVTNAKSMFNNCNTLQYVNMSGMTSLIIANYMFNNCYSLQNIDISGMTSAGDISYMFSGCSALQYVNMSGMTSVTTTAYMFNNCNTLQYVNMSGMTSLTTSNSMFNGCLALQYVEMTTMTNLTTANSMFNNCYSLQNIDISGMTHITTATTLFGNCFSLQNVIATNLGLNASSTDLGFAFYNTELLLNINLPNTKLTKIAARGISGKLNKLETLSYSPSSLFGGSSPHIDISYNTLTAEQLNTIFTDLPTLVGKNITITGCVGASTCTRTIATSKGWTVTG